MRDEQSLEEKKKFWDTRSKSFPGHREGETYQTKMLAIMKGHGIELAGKDILDLGCGSGAYALHMAKEAGSVTALDISDGMLSALAGSAKKNNLKNITCVRSDWMEYRPDKKFDIVFCSLTPALKDREAIEKIRECADNWVVYIGFAGPMHANVLSGLWALHSVDRPSSLIDPIMAPWLHDNGISYTVYPVKGEWLTSRNRQDMLDNCLDVLGAHKITPDMPALEKFIGQFKDEETGLYISKTKYDVEMIIWNNGVKK